MRSIKALADASDLTGQPIYANSSTYDNTIVVVVQAISMSRTSTDLQCKISGHDSSKLIVLLRSQIGNVTDPQFQLSNTDRRFNSARILLARISLLYK
jgi:hypothetical protein